MKLRITFMIMKAFTFLAIMSTNANSQNHFTGPRNMGTVLNTTSNDQGPVISPSGLSLYFASNRSPGGLGANDIYVSQRATLNSHWGAPQNLGATVNSIAGDNPGSFSLDGKTMFLQSTRTDLGGFGGRDIYISTRTNANDDFGWTTPVNLGAVVNTALDDLAPAYFEDPGTGVNSIIFGSNRIGNPSIDYHLYQSTRNANGTFNPPTPIPELNVGGAETRAAIRRDGLEIFITATLPPPGTFDTWVSTRATTTSSWSNPELVPGINSAVEDQSVSLSPDGSILYFFSSRDGGSGAADLYSVTRCSLYSDSPCGVNRTISDFNGDGITDISVFRPSDGTWWVMESGTNTVSVRQFGTNGDKMVPGDYDGDGRNDLAVFRPSDRNWYIERSSDSRVSITNWGLDTDRLVPADYDGDGRTDIAVFRDGVWYIIQSSNRAEKYQSFGLSGDIPVSAASGQ